MLHGGKGGEGSLSPGICCVSNGVGVDMMRKVLFFFALQRSVGESDAADSSHPGCPGLPGLGSRDPESGNAHIMLCRALYATVLLLGCGIAEIPLIIFISRTTGRLACPSIRRS